MDHFTERTACIFCKSKELFKLWEQPREIFLGCYVVSSPAHICHKMPFNILKCVKCKTYQTQYLGDMSIIYNYNASSHGVIRSTMNQLFAEFITTDTHINSILEIGGGNGDLSDILIHSRKDLQYTIVDPTYSGTTTNKTVVNGFFESVSIHDNIDTIVMSHVFEHFYEPTEILTRFKDMKSVKTIFLNFPNLESCIKENQYHVLNPEHIYYAENQFITKLFDCFGFSVKKTYFHNKHSVFFEFRRIDRKIDTHSEQLIQNLSSDVDVPTFFERILERIADINTIIRSHPEHAIYIWPCSMHTTYLIAMGLDFDKIGILDNAPHKIGQYLYGTNKKCGRLSDILLSSNNSIVILNGGCYNDEVKSLVSDNIIFI